MLQSNLIYYKGKSIALRIRQAVLSCNDKNFKQLCAELKQSYKFFLICFLIFFNVESYFFSLYKMPLSVFAMMYMYHCSCDFLIIRLTVMWLCHAKFMPCSHTTITPQVALWKINNQGSTTVFLLIFVMYGFAMCIKELKLINCLMFIASNK